MMKMLLCIVIALSVLQLSHLTASAYHFRPLPKADMFAVDARTNTVIVGGRYKLVEYSSDLSQIIQSVDLPNNFTDTDNRNFHFSDQIEECKKSLRSQPELIPSYCHVDVMLVLLPQSDSTGITVKSITGPSIPINETVLYCTANTHLPICGYRNRSNLNQLIREKVGSGFSSYYNFIPVETFVEGDNEFWSVSISESDIANSIWFDRTNFALDRSKVLWLNADLERRFWFNNAGFANILEMGDYMYIFFWEKAIERKWQVVSRVGRVCKDDIGIYDDRLTLKVFRSFVKTTLVCNASSPGDLNQHYVFPYIVDAVYVEEASLDQKVMKPMIYTTFQMSHPHGKQVVSSSAICVFDVEKIVTALESGELHNFKTGESVNGPSVTCETSVNRTMDQITDVTLSKAVVTNEESILKSATHLIADGERLKRVVVGTATGLDSKKYTIVYALSTHKFEKKLYLYKLTYSTERGEAKASHVSYKMNLPTGEEGGSNYDSFEGKRMKLVNETKMYITAEGGLYLIDTDDCTLYDGCSSCVTSLDPHCAYDFKQNKCVSISSSTDPSFLFQDLINGDEGICTGRGGTPPPPTRTEPNSLTTTAKSTTVIQTTVTPTPKVTEKLVVAGDGDDEIDWWPLGIGVIIGLVVGVLIGIFACFICKWRQNRNDKQGFGDSYTGYHSSSNGNNKSANGSVPNGVQKPNNAFDDGGENAPISVKGSNQSTENKDEKPPLLNLNLKTDNETGLLRKPADLQNSSDSAVSLPTDLNLAESSCGTPETPITNWEYDKFKDNLQQSPDKNYKMGVAPMSQTSDYPDIVIRREKPFSNLSQNSPTFSPVRDIKRESTLSQGSTHYIRYSSPRDQRCDSYLSQQLPPTPEGFSPRETKRDSRLSQGSLNFVLGSINEKDARRSNTPSTIRSTSSKPEVSRRWSTTSGQPFIIGHSQTSLTKTDSFDC